MSAGNVSLYGFETRDIDKRRSDRAGTWDIKALWQRSHEIIGMALQGMKQVDIAKALDITPATVSNTLNSSLGKEKLSGMREEKDEEFKKINEEVVKLTEKALNTYHEIFDSGTVSLELKKKTADTITLEIAGMKAPTRIDARSIHTDASLKEIEEFRARGIAAAKESGFLTIVVEEGESNAEET